MATSGADSDDRLKRVMRALALGVEEWYRRNTPSANPRTVEVTARFNSEAIPARLASLIAPIEEHIKSLESLRILDVGCGYGGLPLYARLCFQAAHVVAMDISDRYYWVGRDVAARENISDLEYVTQDVRHMTFEQEFDLIIMSNVLNYLTTAEQLAQACGNAWRALRRGGVIVVYTPQRWHYREPFTKIPFIHFLPATLRDLIARKTGRRSSLRDIRLPNVAELRSIFIRLGAARFESLPKDPLSLLRKSHVYCWVWKR